MPESNAQLQAVNAFGIDIDQVTRELELERIDAFVASYDRLLLAIASRSSSIRARLAA